MRSLHPHLPAGRALAALDLLLLAWALAWVVVGLSVANEVAGLKELSATVRTTGGAVEEAGRTLQTLESLPVVGDRMGAPAARIEEAGQSAVQSGRSSRGSIDRLSLLLGIAVAVIPSLPLLGFYLPLRIAHRREARALARYARRAGDDPAFLDLLAERAAVNLSYRQLVRIRPAVGDGDGDRERRRDALARAELARLGLTRANVR